MSLDSFISGLPKAPMLVLGGCCVSLAIAGSAALSMHLFAASVGARNVLAL